MNLTPRIAAPLIALAALVAGLAACEEPVADIVCDEFEIAGRIDCVHGGSGTRVVSFDNDLLCPAVDSCTIDYSGGVWTITRDQP